MTHMLNDGERRNTQSGMSTLKGWDLHCHTVFSDGTCTPEQLIIEAKQVGLSGVAITDHDTIQGWDQAAQASKRYHFPVLFGSEITSDAQGISVHVLAYGYNRHDSSLAKLFLTTRQARLARARRMVDLISQDYPITWQSVIDHMKEGEHTTVGRPHIADALVDAGVYATRSEAFAGVCSSASPYYVPTPSPDVRVVIQAIKNAGGVSVIAHPGDIKRNASLLSDSQIAGLAELGLGGLEVWHRGNSPAQQKHLLELAHHLQLLTTGGSDWHGDGKPNRLGEHVTNAATVETILARSQTTSN